MAITVTIDDVEVPVKDGFRVSFSLLNLEEPDKIKGSEAPTLTMPATREVRQLLGGPGMSEVVTNTRPRLRAGNGGQVLYESIVIPVERSSLEYSVSAIGDNAEWFDLAQKQRLRDLNMGISDPITDTLIRDSWQLDAEEQPLYFGPIDYGSFRDRNTAYNITVQKIRPGARCHVFLREAFAQWGFSLTPKGSLATFWKKLWMPNVDEDIAIGENFLRDATATFTQATDQAFLSLNTDHNVAFDTDLFDPSGTYVAPGRYASPFDERVTVTFDYNLTATLTSSNPPFPGVMTVRFELYNFTAGTSMATQTLVTSTLQTTLTGAINFGEHDLNASQQYGIRVRMGSTTTTIHALTLHQIQVKFHVESVEYQENVTVNVARQAPDMTVMELLKAIAGNRCLIFRTNTAHGNVDVWYDREFYRGIDVGIDWRTRINHNEPPKKELPIYTRRIEYRWAEDDDDENLNTLQRTVEAPGYGNHDHTFAEGTKDAQRISMPFAATAMGYLFDGNVFWPQSWKEGGTYQEDTYGRKPRLLIADGLAEGEWTFDGNAETEYPRCYFINPDGRYTLAFGSGEVYGDTKAGTAQFQWSERHRRMTLPTLRADVRIYPDEVWHIDQGIPRLINDGFDDVWMYPQEIHQFSFSVPEFTETVLIPL